MPEMHQPPSDPSDPDKVEATGADADAGAAAGGAAGDDVPPVEEGDEALTEVAGGGEITDIGEGAPSS